MMPSAVRVPRVAIYARQSVAEDQGITQQVADCRTEAERRGWRIVAEYQDNDTSASKDRGSGTGWAAMLRAFDSGEFDVLMVTETSRLSRRLTDVLDVRPPRRGIRVVVTRQGIDTDTDDFALKLLVLVAENEVKVKSERAARYSVERRKAGHPTAGKTPHGYRWMPEKERDQKGTRYVIDEDEASDVRQIFKEFLAGASLGQIARDLSDSGRRTRAEARWHTSTVRRVLMNPLYAALLPPAQPTGKHDLAAIDVETCIPGAWQPIIDGDHLIAARSRLVGVKPNHNGTARRWLLSGLAVCEVCSKPVRSARGETHPTKKKDGSGAAPSQRYHAYRCPAGHFMRNGDIIDEFVAEVCIARLSLPDALDLLAPRADEIDVAVLHAERSELERRDGAIASLIASGKLNPQAAEEALDALASDLRAVNDRIALAVRQDPLADLVGVGDVRAWWEGATLARRRAVIDALMTVEIRPVGNGRRVTTLEAATETVGVSWRK